MFIKGKAVAFCSEKHNLHHVDRQIPTHPAPVPPEHFPCPSSLVLVGGSGRDSPASIVARRTLNLVPSLPRIVRIGDEFQAGCAVSSSVPGLVWLSLSLLGQWTPLDHSFAQTLFAGVPLERATPQKR